MGGGWGEGKKVLKTGVFVSRRVKLDYLRGGRVISYGGLLYRAIPPCVAAPLEPRYVACQIRLGTFILSKGTLADLPKEQILEMRHLSWKSTGWAARLAYYRGLRFPAGGRLWSITRQRAIIRTCARGS